MALTYTPDRPCRHGHRGPRYASNGHCVECAKGWRDRNRDRVRRAHRAWREEHPEKAREATRKWSARNAARNTARVAKRRAMILKATPPWADLGVIRAFYEACPPGHHVDHIHPLKHPFFCGLHVLHNLQHLPALDNLRKGNRLGS